ncbi:hypothetical protein [Halobacterium noricense]|uniref:hypothetical protein n=1 Tax=Halobacterium noricense TaxID=223182 RepID=UPI001E5AF0FB|nr:hypothetical protein [Halobacterium noricense]UHH27293.1 hypothetical protein LT974_17505 [Halobacterium noricense]
MTDAQQPALAVLQDIDANFHRLFESVAETDATESTPAGDPIAMLHRARAQIDAALLDHQRRTDDTSLPDSESCLLQWNPSGTPPRRLVLEPRDGDSWTRRELEWTGDGWRVCRRDTVDDVAIRAPAAPRYPNPVDPPSIDTLLAWVRGAWTHPDPPALVFEATATTEQGVVVAVNDELRYRERDSQQWYTVTEDELYHHLQQQGQPTLQSLAETPLTRQHFTQSPLTQ